MSGIDQRQRDERDVFTRAVFPDGEEPDPRFTLANERTFLAWTRTSLAFLAGGIALEAFAMRGLDEGLRQVASMVLIIVGMAIALGSAFRWMRIERSLRHGKPLPAPGIVPLLGLGIGVASIIVLIALF
ncbi:YidH family protein [Corynebacterium urinipleomorphum]|uniref:YidH family protein n=1 Tax=Corynebacterium urinipleomorphum TaxID=1852380 RepID=UPI000B3584DF|nr:DUF202 domain-containing protein [Corynebacterium urinipleomorphum]